VTATQQRQPEPDETAKLDDLLKDIERFEDVFASWDDNQRAAVDGYRDAVDALHRTALLRMIQSFRASPEALKSMKAAVGDDVVYTVLRYFELIKPSLHEQVEKALDSVRPMLASHGGDVELISVTPPDTVEVKFLGACDGCPASMLTFAAGVKKAIEEQCPQITNIKQVKGLLNGSAEGVNFVSPFALNQKGDWEHVIDLAKVPEGGAVQVEIEGEDVILSKNGSVVSCFQNACAHLGMPIDAGEVSEGIITCPHHGFQYDLRSGECLTAPEVQLQAHAVRVIGHRVEVRLAS